MGCRKVLRQLSLPIHERNAPYGTCILPFQGVQPDNSCCVEHAVHQDAAHTWEMLLSCKDALQIYNYRLYTITVQLLFNIQLTYNYRTTVSACLQLEFATAFHRLCGKKVLFPQGFHCTGMPIKVPRFLPLAIIVTDLSRPKSLLSRTTLSKRNVLLYLWFLVCSLSLSWHLHHLDCSSMLVCFSVYRCIGSHTCRLAILLYGSSAILVYGSSATRLQSAGSDYVQQTRVCDAAGMC